VTQAYFTSAQPQSEPHMPPGWRVMKFDSLDGTNAALRRIVEIEGDAVEGLTLMAKTQTAGRGRMQRTWESPEGNVYASVLVKAPSAEASSPQIGFVAAIAIADAVLEMPRHNAPPPDVTYKWPNDLLVGGGKVCGILPELVSGVDGDRWIVVGFGVNLIEVKVEDAAYPVGALSAQNIDTTPEHAMTLICRALSDRLTEWRDKGFQHIRQVWLERAPTLGSQVSVGTPSGTESGTFAGIDEDGALLLDGPQGRRRILAGDVLFAGGAS